MIMGTDRQCCPCFASLLWRVAVVLLICGGLEVATQDVCATSTRVKSFTLNTESGLAEYTLQQDLVVGSFSNLVTAAQGSCGALAPSSESSSAGSIAAAAVVCLLGGIAIGILVDIYVIPVLRKKKAAAESEKKGDHLAESIVRNPYEGSTERVTYTNPAFHGDTSQAASDPESGASGSSRNSPIDSKPSLTSIGRKSSVQWPQWVGSGGQGAIKKQWRDSVTSQLSTTDDAEAGLIGDGLKKRNWFLGLFKKRPNIKIDIPEASAAGLAATAAAEIPVDGVLPVNEMSAILDDIDQLARDIDDMPTAFPGKTGALAAATVLDAVDFAVPPLQVNAPQLPPAPDMSILDEVVERPQLPVPVDRGMSLASAGKAAASKIAVGESLSASKIAVGESLPASKIAVGESLSAASTAMPKFEHTPLESKTSAKLKTNPFLKGDKKKPGVEVKALEKKRSSGGDIRQSGVGHLAEKFKQEEGTFKRPSLRSVSSKSSDSSKSDPSATPSEIQFGVQHGASSAAAFPRVSLRKVEQTRTASINKEAGSSGQLHQAMSALKKTAPELPPQLPVQESKPQLPPHLPEPLPTESQVDLMEEEGDMYIDPEVSIPAISRSPSAMQGMNPNTFDLSAAMISSDSYLTAANASAAALGQEDYIEMAESAPGLSSILTTSQPSITAPKEGYMQLADAVTGENNEYLDMTGTLPKAPQVAKRKISQGKAAGAARAAANTKVSAKKAQKRAAKEKKGGFFGRLFGGGKAKAASATETTAAQNAALTRLKPGWRVASKATSSVKASDLPLPAPPEWVQQLHQKGRQAYNDDGIYEEYGEGDDDDMYEELNTSPRQHTVDKISKPSEGRVLITAQVREQAIEDLKSTPMPAGNVKRLTSHWVKKTH